MYKLFINNLQIGNYKSVKDLVESVAFSTCLGANTKSLNWRGNSLFITTLN